jgi:hypothetical protein
MISYILNTFFISIILTGLNTLVAYPTNFRDWVKQFNIQFQDYKHENSTFLKWIQNDKYILNINSENRTYRLGHNQFSGLSREEFKQYLGYRVEDSLFNFLVHNKTYLIQLNSLPNSIDWSNNSLNPLKINAVSPVKDQGQCGSCWSFSTTGALEGAYSIKYGNVQNFSEQQLVDCDNLKNGGKDLGCNGGLMDNAFTWINKNGGLCSEENYSYFSGNSTRSGVCQKNCSVVEGSKIQSFIDILSSSDLEMMSALTKQPVSIAIEADQLDFQLYKSGVFTGLCGTKLDHGVLLVGYGSLDGIDYYKVKNSWGTSWGQNGYILLGRGEEYNSGSGQCGLLLDGSYPLL